MKVRLRHTFNIQGSFKKAAEILGITHKHYEAFAEVYKSLAKKKIKKEDFQKYLEVVFPISPEAKRSRKESIREDVTELFDGKGQGSQLATARGTAWGAWNAVTEYADHLRNFRAGENRLRSVWFGSSQDIKQRSFDTLLKMV